MERRFWRAQRISIKKNLTKWKLRSSTFIWYPFHGIRQSMSYKKATSNDERNLTGRVTFLRSKLVCACPNRKVYLEIRSANCDRQSLLAHSIFYLWTTPLGLMKVCLKIFYAVFCTLKVGTGIQYTSCHYTGTNLEAKIIKPKFHDFNFQTITVTFAILQGSDISGYNPISLHDIHHWKNGSINNTSRAK